MCPFCSNLFKVVFLLWAVSAALLAKPLSLEHIKSDKTFEEIRIDENWKPIGDSFAFGYDYKKHWFRFIVKNNHSTPELYYLGLNGSNSQKSDFYLVRKSSIEFYPNGSQVALEEKSIKNVLPMVSIQMDPLEEIEVYVHYENCIPAFGEFRLLTKSEYEKNTNFHTVFFLLFFGALAIGIFYNLFLFISLRDLTYGYYVGHALFFGIWAFLFSGFWVYFFGKDWYYILQASMPIGYAFFSLYSLTILEIRDHYPLLRRIVQGIALLLVLVAVWIVVDIETGYRIGNGVGILFSPFFVLLAILSWKKGVKSAKYYLLALLIYLSMLFLMAMMAMGLVEYHAFIKYAFIGGSFMELMLFSLILAYRIFLLQESQIATQKKLAQMEASRAEELSLMVEDRTRDLALANTQLTKALEEKNLLFNEVHHRVRNNLQSIMGLLYAKSRSVKHPDAKKALEESSAKVRAIGVVHELLYACKNLEEVDMEQYLVNLAQDIAAIMGQKTTIKADIEPFTLKMDSASVVGMIAVEVLTNALKYATPSDDKVLVLTITSKNNNGHISLVIKDNGAIKPKEELTNSKGMGMTIVSQMARRLINSKHRFWWENGICFELEFDVK